MGPAGRVRARHLVYDLELKSRPSHGSENGEVLHAPARMQRRPHATAEIAKMADIERVMSSTIPCAAPVFKTIDSRPLEFCFKTRGSSFRDCLSATLGIRNY